jgi:hypothetical protein
MNIAAGLCGRESQSLEVPCEMLSSFRRSRAARGWSGGAGMTESLECRLPMSRGKIREGEFSATAVSMEEVHERYFIGKVVPAYIDHRQTERDGLDDGSISRFGHENIDGGKDGLIGKRDGGE